MSISSLHPPSSDAPLPGMDRKIERQSWWRKPRLLVAAIGAVLLLVAAGFGLKSISGNRQSVVAETLTIATVRSGIFEDYVPVRGRVTPSMTVFLDSIEGGRVEKILAEDGAQVRKGQLLAILSNTALQFDVIRSEAEVAQQLNNLRAQEIALERNRLDNKRSMIETEVALDKINRQMSREQALAEGGWVADAKIRDTRAEAKANGQRIALLRETQRTDLMLQQAQLAQLRDSAQQLQKSLTLARSNLDALNIRAPLDGQVSAFDLQIGQSVSRGERLGQIDSPGRNKLQADIDEYYLDHVVVGQAAQIEQDGKAYAMKLAKIYPNVKNGNFRADLTFAASEPASLRRGQTLEAKLTLSDPSKAKLIPRGAFYADTGGSWIFVVSMDGRKAVKRTVRLGRRNSTMIEVVDGLQIGERVITSPYTAFLDRDRLDLSAN
jgi:HlyD family secretion protein